MYLKFEEAFTSSIKRELMFTVTSTEISRESVTVVALSLLFLKVILRLGNKTESAPQFPVLPDTAEASTQFLFLSQSLIQETDPQEGERKKKKGAKGTKLEHCNFL